MLGVGKAVASHVIQKAGKKLFGKLGSANQPVVIPSGFHLPRVSTR